MATAATVAFPVPPAFNGPRQAGTARRMTAGDFDAVYRSLFTACAAALKNRGSFAATAFALQVTRSGGIALACPVPLAELVQQHGQAGKQMTADYLAALLELDTVDFAVIVSDAWKAPVDPGDNPLPASQHPDRAEVQMFNVMSRECQALAACPVLRDSNTARVVTVERIPLRFIAPGALCAEGVFARDSRTRH